jgi:hypothetical protein
MDMGNLLWGKTLVSFCFLPFLLSCYIAWDTVLLICLSLVFLSWAKGLAAQGYGDTETRMDLESA